MIYRSGRCLDALAEGLILGVGDMFGTELAVDRHQPNEDGAVKLDVSIVDARVAGPVASNEPVLEELAGNEPGLEELAGNEPGLEELAMKVSHLERRLERERARREQAEEMAEHLMRNGYLTTERRGI